MYGGCVLNAAGPGLSLRLSSFAAHLPSFLSYCPVKVANTQKHEVNTSSGSKLHHVIIQQKLSQSAVCKKRLSPQIWLFVHAKKAETAYIYV